MAFFMYTQGDSYRLRREEEKADLGRSPYRRDFARLLHSPSFRRLQGKTQLFPGSESDFFRNRLTHSLEVAQIAKGIAQYLNATDPTLKLQGIDVDLVEFAGLAHDLGHPPFGHNGEHALDQCMVEHGGFEGNAQTLRILTRVERKVFKEGLEKEYLHGIGAEGEDMRLGLNLCMRTLAAVLKYDSEIPSHRATGSKLAKGYYGSERAIVDTIKSRVAPGHSGKFKTLECQIMDIADDIAYSIYDLEDAMKAGFLSQFEIVRQATADGFTERLTDKIKESIPDVTSEQVVDAIMDAVNYEGNEDTMVAYEQSRIVAESSHARTQLSSSLVHSFMMGISFEPADNVALSRIVVAPEVQLKIEALKHFNYLAIIESPKLKVTEYRGGEIVKGLFEAFTSTKGQHLLPSDVQTTYTLVKGEANKKRILCDFIAGMTDRYAADFYNRLFGSTSSLFIPL